MSVMIEISQKDKSLLSSLTQKGVDVNYQCLEGYCGSCRATIVKGDVEYTTEPLAYLRDNEVLTCCSQPKDTVVLEIN